MVNVATPTPSPIVISFTVTFGTPSLSLMVPIPVIPPIVSGTVSFGSSVMSCTVGKVTVNEVTPAGTARMPLLKVTPLLNVGAELISPKLAVPPLFKL